MENQDSQVRDSESRGSSRRIAFSGPLVSSKKLSGSRRSARFKDETNGNNPYIEITLDVANDSLLVHNIKGTPDQDAAFIASRIEKHPSSLSTQLSSKLRQISRDLKNSFSSSKRSTHSNNKVKHSASGAAQAIMGLKFIHKNGDGWSEVEARFDELAVDGLLPRSSFGKCIGVKESSEFMGELFDALARRRGITSSNVTKDQLHEFWKQITDTSFDARLQTFFDMVDKDADGRITQDEVKEIITLSASANKLTKILECADEYAALIMEELDPSNLGYVEMYNVEMLLLRAPHEAAFSGTESRMLSNLISEKLVPPKDESLIKRGYRRIGYFIHDNWKRLWILCLWLLICVGLFTWKFHQYKDRAVYHVMGYCVCVAKGGAETLKFNMAVILLPVCRNTITWLRSRTRLGRIIPFDDNVNFHKVIATGIAIGVCLHVIPHLTCDFPRLLHSTDEEYEPMRRFFGHRPSEYWWFVRGTEGWTGITMLVLMTIAFTLANPWFRQNRLQLPKMIKRLTGYNAFWYSHHLFIIVYVLLIIHGTFVYLSKEWYHKTTWMYVAFPMILYGIERLVRAFRSGRRTVEILKVAVYPGNVMSLQFTKPRKFKYTSGQYIYVNCSKVSPVEWHPFSLTSAPPDDHLSLHIRTAGDWTSQLKTVFSRACQPSGSDQSGLLRADIAQQNQNIPRLPKLLIDGPYGAPAQDYKEYDVLLLIGLGIGATPLISIVKDVLYHIKQQKEEQSGIIESGTRNRKKRKPFNTTNAYFYWVTREEGSFEWFKNVMNEVAEKDTEHVIELHNYCTSVYEEGDARSALIAMLQSFQHAKNGVDIVSGTRVRTHFARPNWRNEFKHVAVKHPDKRVGVFYCGAVALISELRHLSHDFSRKTTTKFDFHKENF
ncbi:respiratory burst oxidase-like [Heracleum sosnowskyi]|uniref:Respiratory burst oxidase-like n=1 Tax=Heracleum sosnowskyi TaxID=360622 RepID=A0AAD8JDU2_9APIA|nr:respiratory burst oxidase-like [Heracleum sosnowskyi]